MRATLNRRFLVETGVDSGALTILGSVIHPFAAGEYAGTVWKGEQAVGQFVLHVTDESDAAQADIDLARLAAANSAAPLALKKGTVVEGCEPEREMAFWLNPKGYAVFFVSQGAGGYAVTVWPAASRGTEGEGGGGRPGGPVGRLPTEARPPLAREFGASGGPTPPAGEMSSMERRAPAFDSRMLNKGDLFAVTLLQPGTYVAETQGGKAEISVAYPTREAFSKGPLPPVTIKVTERGFDPGGIRVMSSQGQVYQILAPARVRIAMVKRLEEPPEATQPPVRRPGAVVREGAVHARSLRTFSWRGPRPKK